MMMSGSDMLAARLNDGLLMHLATRALDDSARIIDALDALPVPPKCQTCGDFGTVMGERQTEEHECPDCNGTGKARTNDDG